MTAKTKPVSERADHDRHEIRLDVWLWATRFFKTRPLAKKAIEGGKIRIDEREARASTAVRIGQHMAIVRGEERFEIAVTGLPAKRRSASVAAGNFLETDASIAARRETAEKRRMLRDGYGKPPTKPDKRARRLIKALGDIDML
jgi:ribosome-associated heat shock protein Hsp15